MQFELANNRKYLRLWRITRPNYQPNVLAWKKLPTEDGRIGRIRWNPVPFWNQTWISNYSGIFVANIPKPIFGINAFKVAFHSYLQKHFLKIIFLLKDTRRNKNTWWSYWLWRLGGYPAWFDKGTEMDFWAKSCDSWLLTHYGTINGFCYPNFIGTIHNIDIHNR